MNKKLFYSIVAVIILVSFRFYSANFYPILNSDDAVSILMLYDFKLPDDLYYWGQDRYGSLIPLIGQFFFKIFKFSALTSESITHYLLLIAGYLGFSTLFRSDLNKLIFAVIWFFPPSRMTDLLRFNLGVQYCLIGISVWGLNKLYLTREASRSLMNHLLFFIVTIALILSIWVSDLSIITIFLLLSVFAFSYLMKSDFQIGKIFRRKTELYYVSGGIIISTLFIYYAKSGAKEINNYQSVNDFNAIIESVRIFGESIGSIFSLRSGDLFSAIYSYIILIILGLCLFNLPSYKFNSWHKKWFLFFFLDSICVFLAIMLSKWSFLNDVPRRYFIPVYVSSWVAFLISVENIQSHKLVKKINILLIIAVIMGGVGSLYHIRYVWPKTLTPRVEIAQEFKRLGNIGIISDYWNSYINSCSAPDMIKATPHEEGGYRNEKLAHEVLAQKNIYVIKDMWFDHFPDTLHQFGHVLIKDGQQFYLGDSYVCKYKRLY